ncbi:hypothetical protein [Demequina sp.]|uniref:hypothetical protein n=1 Tax=Demequina sp. TaxID=2050685 RepID=UPI003D149349
MNKLTNKLLGTAAIAALLVGGIATSANAYPPGTSPSVTVPSTAKAGASVTVKGTKYKPAAKVKVTLSSKSVSLTASSTGAISGKITAPKTAGKYKVTFTSPGEKTVAKYLTVGKPFKKASISATNITSKWSTGKWIKVTGAKNSTVIVKVTPPKGGITASIPLRIPSRGYVWYYYQGAFKKGTYTVSVTYKATSTYYGAKVYTKTFKKTR